mmetsp:Transcript_63127/g.168156  ORF Transcript_63127/g.168156 Transcript_63127/m.168156 type:complete len:320 (-) Transcript_63127:8-967(-)
MRSLGLARKERVDLGIGRVVVEKVVRQLSLAVDAEVIVAAEGVLGLGRLDLVRLLVRDSVDDRVAALGALDPDDARRVALLHHLRELARLVGRLAQLEPCALVALVKDERLAPLRRRHQVLRPLVHRRRLARAARRRHREDVGRVGAREDARRVLGLHPEALAAVGAGRRVSVHPLLEVAPQLWGEEGGELRQHPRRRILGERLDGDRLRRVELDDRLVDFAVREVAAIHLVLEAERCRPEAVDAARCHAHRLTRIAELRRCSGRLEGVDIKGAGELLLERQPNRPAGLQGQPARAHRGHGRRRDPRSELRAFLLLGSV